MSLTNNLIPFIDKEYEIRPTTVCISYAGCKKTLFLKSGFCFSQMSGMNLKQKKKAAHSRKSNYLFPFNIDVVQNV